MARTNVPNINEMWPHPIFQFKDQGSESRDSIYLSVGRVCSAWEIIEINLGLIFGQFAESSSAASERAYGAISNSSSRKAALELAAEIYHDRHPNFPINEFNLLMGHYAKAAGYRNKIAHGVVIEHTDEGTSKGCFLVPSFFASNQRHARTSAFWAKATETEDPYYAQGNAYRYTDTDIDFFYQKFDQLAGYFVQLISEMIQANTLRTMQTGNLFMHEVRE